MLTNGANRLSPMRLCNGNRRFWWFIICWRVFRSGVTGAQGLVEVYKIAAHFCFIFRSLHEPVSENEGGDSALHKPACHVHALIVDHEEPECSARRDDHRCPVRFSLFGLVHGESGRHDVTDHVISVPILSYLVPTPSF